MPAFAILLVLGKLDCEGVREERLGLYLCRLVTPVPAATKIAKKSLDMPIMPSTREIRLAFVQHLVYRARGYSAKTLTIAHWAFLPVLVKRYQLSMHH